MAGELDAVAQAMQAQLEGLQLQLGRLRACAGSLKQQAARRPLTAEQAAQADAGGVRPLQSTARAAASHAPGEPFAFAAPSERISWKRLRQLDVQQLLRSNDTETVLAWLSEVAHGDVQMGSMFEASEDNLRKLFQLAQLQLQLLQHQLDAKRHEEQVLQADALALAAGLGGLDAPSLGDMQAALSSLGTDLRQLGTSRVGGLIEQVRAEERHAAASACCGASTAGTSACGEWAPAGAGGAVA